jgi:hypothetical protein
VARSLLDHAPAIACEKQKGRHCADLSYRYDVLRQYIRGRGPKANYLQ